MLVCTKCKIEKTESEFYKDKRRKNGLRSWCISCQNDDNKKREKNYNQTRKDYRETHKDEYRKLKKDYYIKNRESLLSVNSKWRQTLNGRWSTYRNDAKHRKIKWELTKEEFSSFWNNVCDYCGEQVNGIGIDRVDSKLGYCKTNVVPCCSLCNTIKLNLTYEEFIGQIIKVYENLNLCNIKK